MTIKGLQWLLLKHSDKLDLERNEAQCLKEDLAQIRTQGSKALAAIFLDDWCRRARATGVRVLQAMANTLQGHRTGILSWCDYPMSSGPMEGINDKIGALHEAKVKFLV
jgi:transposase